MFYWLAASAAFGLALWTVALITHNRNRDRCPECVRRHEGRRTGEVAARDRHPSPSSYWATECDTPGCYCHKLH